MLYNYWIETENAVRSAIENIGKRLSIAGDIPYFEYGRLVINLLSVKYNIGMDIGDCPEKLVKNLQGKGRDVQADALFQVFTGEKNLECRNEYAQLQQCGLRSTAQFPTHNFHYRPQEVEALCALIDDKRLYFVSRRRFFADFDVEKLVAMPKECTSAQMNLLRNAFSGAYHLNNIKAYLQEDGKRSGNAEKAYKKSRMTAALIAYKKGNCGISTNSRKYGKACPDLRAGCPQKRAPPIGTGKKRATGVSTKRRYALFVTQ